MKKIAVIGLKGLPAFGGAAAVGEAILTRLEGDFDITILSVDSHAKKNHKKFKDMKQIVFSSFGNGGVNTFIYYIKCLFYVFFNKFDLIYLHHAESGFITPFLRIKYKVIVTIHGVYRDVDPKFSSFQNKFFRFSERLNIKYANQIISVSGPDKEYLESKYHKKVEYIPNGIDIRETKKELIKEQIFFAAGRIYQIKGLHLLLDSAKLINTSIPILIAGDLNQVFEYKKKINILSKGLNVEYLNLIKSKERLLSLISESRLFVFPSLTEAMSMMLLEVVSVKTPVIASDIPSNKAIFNDNEILFFKSGDSEDLSKKLKYALKNPTIMKKKSELAYQKLENEYNWSVISKEYKKKINELVNN